MPVDKSALPLVAVQFMNDDHHEAADLANVLEAALDAETIDEAAVGEALHAFVDHTREHFGREEEAMRRTQFPVYAVHKEEHDQVLEGMDAVVADWAAGKDAAKLLQWVRGPMPEWLVLHIQTMDTITAGFIAGAE